MEIEVEVAVATYNKGKIKEIEKILNTTKYKVKTPDDLGIKINIIEDGNNFVENSTIKAKTFGSLAQKITIADDSGLEIDFLNGEPGVNSAIYLGESASYNQRFEHILAKMKDVPQNLRLARFVCVIAIYEPIMGRIETVSSFLNGFISEEIRGENGFGYDPIFYVPQFGKTLAELNIHEKNKISHRAKALELAVAKLKNLEGINLQD